MQYAFFLSFQRKEWVRKNPKLQLDPTRILLVKLSATFEFKKYQNLLQ